MRLFSTIFFILISFNNEVYASSSLSYSGRLVQASGAPVSGPVNLRAELVYTNATSTILCSQNLTSVALTKGVFHLKLDLNCTPKTITQVLSETPNGESVAIRIIDQTNSKSYPLQAIHSVPFSKVAEQLPQMGASTGQALAWDGTKWAPTAVGTGNGTVTNIVTGTGLTGGPISTTGTISVAAGGITSTELSANAVTASKINAGEISNSHISSSAAIDYSKLNIPNTTIPYAKLQINDGDIPASKVSGLSGVIDDILASIITNGDITHAPTGDAVFDALALKADTTNIAQTITALAVTGLGTPSSNSDAVNKQYVDNAISTLTTNANSKVSKTGDSMSGSLTVTGTVSATTFSGDGSGLTGVSVDPNSNIQLSGETAKTIGVLRRTAPDSAGTVLTVNSSGATTGATNKNGGNLVLSSGAATGYGSSAIEFQTSGGGTTGTADSLPTTKMVIDGNGHVGIGVTGLYHDLTIKRNTPGATAIQLVDNSSGVGSSDGVTMSLNGSVYGLKHQETGGVIRFSTLEDSYAMEVKGDRVGINRYNPGSHLDISLGGATATDALRINSIDAAAGDLLIVKPNGNVGIGVLAPTQKLDVAGNVNATQLCIAGDCKSSWPSMTVGAGSVTSTEIADGTIQTADLGNAQVTYAKLNLTDGDIPLAKLNGASDATKYLRGDKTWSTFATDAINSVLSTFTVGTGTKPAVTNADTVASAFGKVQKTLNDINADYVSKTQDQVINGTLAINSATGFITVPTPINPNDAANKAYVDGFGQWLKNGSNIYFNTGNVGVGTLSPAWKLHINGSGKFENQLNVAPTAGIHWHDTTTSTTSKLLTRVGNTYTGGLELWSSGGSLDIKNPWGLSHMYIQMGSAGDSGNIGIGTTTPGAKLEVTGQVKITGGTPGTGKVLTSDATGLATWEIPGAGAAAGANTQIQYNNAGVLSANSMFVWNHANSRLGIGTTNPGYKLDVVNGTVHATSPCGGSVELCSAIFGDASGSSPAAGVYGVASNATAFGVYGKSTGLGTGGYFTSTSGAALVTGTGNVGLGVNSPSEKLEVNGDVKANFFYAGRTGLYNDGGGAIASEKWIRIAETGNPYTEISWGKILIVASGRGTSHAEISFSCSGFGNCDISVDKFVVPSSSMTISTSSGIKGVRVVYDSATFANPAYIDVLMRNDGGSGATTMTSYLTYGKNTILNTSLVEASTSTPARTILLNDSNSMLSNSFARGNVNFTRAGSVGIGTTTPNAKLQVVGGTTSLEQSAWNYPALTNGWSNYGGGYANFGYRIDSMGYLRLRGLIKNGSAGSANSFVTLPVGFRPLFIQEFVVAAPSGTANIIINSSGVMYVETMSSNAWISLDNVSLPLD